MERWNKKVAVVTGASAGIGAAVCEKLVSHGVKVVGLARRVDRIKERAEKLKDQPGKLYSYKCDITKTEDVAAAFDWIKENVGHVEILINNAGVWRMGSLVDGNPLDWQETLNTNVFGITLCFKHAVAHMKEIDADGYIVNINSIAGHKVIVGTPPMRNMYSPAKHAVTCLNEIMLKELNYYKSKIRVTSLSPGIVATELFDCVENFLEDYILKRPHLSPDDIANTIEYLLSTPAHILIKELTILPVGQNLNDG